jgi:hypothetical protein
MHWLYMAARFYPFLGLALMGVFIQFGVFYRRKGSKMSWLHWALALAMLGSVVAWIVLEGYRYSDQWVRSFLQLAPEY